MTDDGETPTTRTREMNTALLAALQLLHWYRERCLNDAPDAPCETCRAAKLVEERANQVLAMPEPVNALAAPPLSGVLNEGARTERLRIRALVRELRAKWRARTFGDNDEGWQDIEGAFRAVQALDEVLRATRATRRSGK